MRGQLDDTAEPVMMPSPHHEATPLMAREGSAPISAAPALKPQRSFFLDQLRRAASQPVMTMPSRSRSLSSAADSLVSGCSGRCLPPPLLK